MNIPESVRNEARDIFFHNIGFYDSEKKMIRAIALAILEAEKRGAERERESYAKSEILENIVSNIRNRTGERG